MSERSLSTTSEETRGCKIELYLGLIRKHLWKLELLISIETELYADDMACIFKSCSNLTT
ncbi:ORF82 [White spot syndrome virus]|uniref:ORF82 n=1 Tax=White spot syndrome virus TaxID=342409 RepID=A0A2D3I795_9VIRU|nr:ORF82 [White spot syndrome virus]